MQADISLCVSIVSHEQYDVLEPLLSALVAEPLVQRVVITLNAPEVPRVRSPKVQYIANSNVKGFAANHNAAFIHCVSTHFLVLNPDTTVSTQALRALCAAAANIRGAVLAPVVIDHERALFTNVRRFPRLGQAIGRLVRGEREGGYRADAGLAPFPVDWASGMALLFPREVYIVLGGFDQRYFLYYEDVDLCRRAMKAGVPVIAIPDAVIEHTAQFASRRSFRLLRTHVQSAARYFLTS